MVNHEITSDMLTSSEVASLLGLHINTVRRWCDQGIITARRVGPRKDRRITLREVKRYLESNIY